MKYHCIDCKTYNLITPEQIADTHCPMCGIWDACGCICLNCFIENEKKYGETT